MNRFAKGAENNPLLRQLFTIGSRHRNGVKNSVYGDLFPLAHGDAELIERLFHLFTEEAVLRTGLLYCTGLRSARIIAATAGWRRVVAVILIIQLVIMGFQPVRFFHLQPGTVSAQAELQHPLGFVAFGRDGAHDIFVDAFRQLIGLQLREEPFFIIKVPAAPGIYITRCFSITRHSTAYTPKLSPQPHSFWAFGL